MLVYKTIEEAITCADTLTVDGRINITNQQFCTLLRSFMLWNAPKYKLNKLKIIKYIQKMLTNVSKKT